MADSYERHSSSWGQLGKRLTPLALLLLLLLVSL
jgi:hypothetical protein